MVTVPKIGNFSNGNTYLFGKYRILKDQVKFEIYSNVNDMAVNQSITLNMIQNIFGYLK